MTINNDILNQIDLEETEDVLMSNKKYSHFVRDAFREEYLKEKHLQKKHNHKKAINDKEKNK